MDTIPTEGFDAALTLTDTLDHLPANKRRELARILEIIFSEVEQFCATKQSAKKANGKILKVILYGSYARGDWVDDRLSGYRSDYDILIVVNTESFVQERDLWLSLDERFLQEQITHQIETPVIPIVHSLHDLNDQLSRGRPFFVDIARDGKVLYEEEGIRWPSRNRGQQRKPTPRHGSISIGGFRYHSTRLLSRSSAFQTRSRVTVHSCSTIRSASRSRSWSFPLYDWLVHVSAKLFIEKFM